MTQKREELTEKAAQVLRMSDVLSMGVSIGNEIASTLVGLGLTVEDSFSLPSSQDLITAVTC